MSFSLALAIAAAAPFADLDAVDREVARFTGSGIGQPGGAIAAVDRRLRLNPCVSPLALTWRTQQQQTVVVQCPDAAGWRLYVPVKRVAPQAALPAVNRGDAVTIAVSGDGFSVSQPGEALESGTVGSWIRVRAVNNTRRFSNDSLRARIVRPGLVGIPLP
ncbi:MAG: flagella basal body P-ring formation protein FlgA [Novosphingobium sp.]|nr:flagella basal body P-ring formation protein FlgA [Novosphingobium sp.]MCP5401055.1 flagella basal body P-ring formation protein FlgA [Novosphingobium sp.]